MNGSVGGWTSSQVGAQVTYYCDTDLVLVGERVAHCSLPSLQWIPSSDDVVCMPQTSGTLHYIPSTERDVLLQNLTVTLSSEQVRSSSAITSSPSKSLYLCTVTFYLNVVFSDLLCWKVYKVTEEGYSLIIEL